MMNRIKTNDLTKSIYPFRFLKTYLRWDDMLTEEERPAVTKEIYCVEGPVAEKAIADEGSVLVGLGSGHHLSNGVWYCFAIRTFDGVKHYTPFRATASLKTLRNWNRQVRKFGYGNLRFQNDPM